jgi:hypothetical protein
MEEKFRMVQEGDAWYVVDNYDDAYFWSKNKNAAALACDALNKVYKQTAKEMAEMLAAL